MDRAELYERIDRRIDAMVGAGALEEVKTAHEASGQKTETFYADYRPVSGVQVAHKTTVLQNGTKAAEITFTEVQVNAEVDPAVRALAAVLVQRPQDRRRPAAEDQVDDGGDRAGQLRYGLHG